MEETDAIPAPRPTPTWRARLFRYLPYVVAVLVIAFILRQYSLGDIIAEIRKGDALPMVPIALVTYVISLLFVGLADRIVIGAESPENAPGYFGVMRGKAAAVVLHIVHYALGQGAYGTWIARRTGIGVARASGLMLYIVAAELCSVCAYAAIVIGIGKPAVPTSLFYTVIGVSGVLTAFVVFSAVRPGEPLRFLGTWKRVGPKRGILQLLVRLCQHATTTTGTWLAAQAFGLDIPMTVMLSYLPVILVVASLPVNVAGLGAVQGAWLLLAPWAPGERILAFSIVWQAFSAGALVLRGLPFLSGVMRDIREGQRAA
jgi:hypothetical protein